MKIIMLALLNLITVNSMIQKVHEQQPGTSGYASVVSLNCTTKLRAGQTHRINPRCLSKHPVMLGHDDTRFNRPCHLPHLL